MHHLSRETIDAVVGHNDGHMRVLGPPASGKTSLIVERFRSLSSNADRADAVAVIAYTREAARRLTRALLPEAAARFGRAPVMTYHQLALDILERAPNAPRLIGEMEEMILLDRVLRDRRDDLRSDLATIAGSEAFRRSALGVVRILLQRGVTSDQAESAADEIRSGRGRDLLRVYRDFRRSLASNSLATYYDVAGRAAEALATHRDANPLAGAGVILVDDFHDVDPGQYRMLQAIAPADGSARVNVFGDPTGARFGHRGTTADYLLDVFPGAYGPADFVLPVDGDRWGGLGTVITNLIAETAGETFAAHAAPPVDAETAGDRRAADESAIDLPLWQGVERTQGTRTHAGGIEVTIDVVEDETAEVAVVARRVAGLIASGQYRPGDIAVAARELERYETALARALRDHGVAADAGRPGVYALDGFVRALLGLMVEAGDPFNRRAVSTSPFYDELCEFAGADDRDAGDDGASTDASRSTRDATRLDTVLGWLAESAKDGDGEFAMDAFIATAIHPLVRARAFEELAPESLSLLTRVRDEWERYREMKARVGDRAELRQFLRVGRTLSSGVDRSERDTARVGLYACHELSTRTFPVVFLLGCSELIFPAPPARDGYIPYDTLESQLAATAPATRVAFVQNRSPEAHLSAEHALLLTSVTRATGALHVTAPEQFGDAFYPAPSAALRPLLDEAAPPVPRDPPPYQKLASGIAGLTASFAADRAALAKQLGPIVPRADDIGWLWAQAPPQGERFRRVSALSASALTAYTTCQRKFFYTKVLRVREPETINLVLGKVFHRLAEILTREYPTADARVAALRSDRVDVEIERLLRREGITDAASLVARSLRVHLGEMTRNLGALDSLRSRAYGVAEVEEWFEMEHEGASFRGKLDRVDAQDDASVFLVDYKTGGLNKTGATIRKLVLPTCTQPERRLWQVPLYSHAWRSAGHELPAGFFFYGIAPGTDPFVVGLFIGAEGAEARAADVFDKSMKRKFAHLTGAEIDECLADATAVAQSVCGEREGYPRTEVFSRCRVCAFNRVCERKGQ